MADQDDKCFACGRRIAPERRERVVVWGEDQSPFVGPECYRQIRKAELAANRVNEKALRETGRVAVIYVGWQPPRGGPKLGLIGSKG